MTLADSGPSPKTVWVAVFQRSHAWHWDAVAFNSAIVVSSAAAAVAVSEPEIDCVRERGLPLFTFVRIIAEFDAENSPSVNRAVEDLKNRITGNANRQSQYFWGKILSCYRARAENGNAFFGLLFSCGSESFDRWILA
jgi:hypothetical protein